MITEIAAALKTSRGLRCRYSLLTLAPWVFARARGVNTVGCVNGLVAVHTHAHKTKHIHDTCKQCTHKCQTGHK